MADRAYDPARIDWEAYRYALYARRFGWTPVQVRKEVPIHLDRQLLRIDRAIEEEISRRQEKAVARAGS